MKIKAVFLKALGDNYTEHSIQKIDKKQMLRAIEDMKLRIEKATHEEIHSKKLENTEVTISYKGKTFIIPPFLHSLKSKRDIIMYFDWDTEKMLFFKEHKTIFDAKFLDRLINNQIIGQLVGKLKSSLEKPEKFQLLGKIMVPVLCLVAGVFIGAYAL